MSSSLTSTKPAVELIAVTTDPGGKLTVTLAQGDTFYRLEHLVPDFEPVESADTITRPAAFDNQLEDRFTRAVECHTTEPYGYQSLAETVVMFFLMQLEGLTPGETLSFSVANDMAIAQSDGYLTQGLAAASYHWAKAAAAAWRDLKSQIGQVTTADVYYIVTPGSSSIDGPYRGIKAAEKAAAGQTSSQSLLVIDGSKDGHAATERFLRALPSPDDRHLVGLLLDVLQAAEPTLAELLGRPSFRRRMIEQAQGRIAAQS